MCTNLYVLMLIYDVIHISISILIFKYIHDTYIDHIYLHTYE